MIPTVSLCGILLAALLAVQVTAQNAPLPIQGAALLKTDLMGVFAHPDDETGVASTLARYALAEGKVAANVYCTRGEGGGNMVGTQAGPALGVLREAELRACLAKLGVRYCYFLDQQDWAYTESLSATFEKWGKEETLRRLVRMIRALRPEVMVTMNPAPTPGQHGHHQAAGVLATEAFDAAADPSRFPEQLSKEGLTVWQPRKLYYGGANPGTVATITTDQRLPDGDSPAGVAAQALTQHRSQAFGNFGNSPWFRRPQSFTLVKSVLPFVEAETDLFRGLPLNDPAPRRVSNARASGADSLVGMEFIPRPAIENYNRWVKEQGIAQVAARFTPDLPVIAGEANRVQLVISNGSAQSFSGEIHLAVPPGWKLNSTSVPSHLASRGVQAFNLQVTPPADAGGDADISAALSISNITVEAKARLHPAPAIKVPRTKPLSVEAGEANWSRLPAHAISPTNLVQGKVADAADSSAVFRLGHDGRNLYVEVAVMDDRIVSNIAPNDIKGHWRSDSVEICLDPAGGAAHTMNCYKIGIFPFDSTGRIRAARDADANQGPIEETAPGTRLTSWRTAQGYTIQAKIPLREVGFKSGKSNRLGFNAIIYDGDKPDAAMGENINKSRIAWSPRSGVQGRPEDWGRIDLE